MNTILLLTALTFAAEPSGEATETPAQNKTSQEAPKEEATNAAANPTEAPSTTSNTPSTGEQTQSQEDER